MKQKTIASKGKKLLAAFVAGATFLSGFSTAVHAESAAASMPSVKNYEKTSGSFAVSDQSRLYFVSDTMPTGEIADTLKLVAGESAAKEIGSGEVMDIVYGSASRVRSKDIVIRLGDVENDGADPLQAYEMEITEDNVTITAEGALGIKYAMNTLMQNNGVLECGSIEDYPDVKERSVFLDCGRKFYEADTIKAMIKDMSWNKMNVLYLDFSNNKGFRFALDDMNLTWADGAKSDDLSKIVSQKTLRESDMDEILALADLYGVTVIPTLNSPGHMDTILASYPQYQKSASTINLDDPEARSFVMNLVEKYAEYFRSRGCTFFNISADEATGYDTKSQTYIDYTSDLNAMLKEMGYQVRMFNDGIKAGDANLIDTDIQVLYWEPGTANANVLELLKSGHDLVNFAADYMYYAYGNGSFVCSANNIYDGTYVRETHNKDDEIAQHNKGWNPGKFSKMGVKQQMSFINGEFVYPTQGELSGKVLGASYAIWADNANDSVSDQSIIKDVYDKIKVTAERSWRVNTDSIQDPLYDDGIGYDVEQGSQSDYEEFVKRQMANSMAPGGMSNDGVIDTANTVLPQAGEITLDTADKTALDEAIAEVEKLDASKYTMDSWKQVESALEEAKAVSADQGASDEAVAAAEENLKQAVAALELKNTATKPDEEARPDEDKAENPNTGTANASASLLLMGTLLSAAGAVLVMRRKKA